MTFHASKPAVIQRVRFQDAVTFDRATIDSAGAFLNQELERIDQTMNAPLVDFTWTRDVPLRTDVTMGDDFASFTNSSFASVGGINPTGKSWVAKDGSAIASVGLDIGKTVNSLFPWGKQVSWTVFELASAQVNGRPVDTQKVDGARLNWNMDADEMVYIGDTFVGGGVKGLTNLASVTPANVPADGTGSSALWTAKTPAQILRDVNAILNAAWEASAFAVVPTKLLLPPAQFAYIVSQLVSSAADKSILAYLKDNTITLAKTGRPLEIQPLKWLTGRGAGGTDRMVAYSQEYRFLRFPLVELQRTPLEYRDLRQITTYYGKLGQVETPYAETIAYRDGI